MLTFESRSNVHEVVSEWKRAGLRVGFVPTMGALHEGHLALVSQALRENDRVVASIFVNPLQFGPNEDFTRYPRTLDVDSRMLDSVGCHAVYLPHVDEMYPSGADTHVVQEVAPKYLCGEFRPGHFTGVLTVVLKLIAQVAPHVLYLGRKDFQQVVAITRMVRHLDLDLELEVKACATVREPDGLALSSRNRYLTPEERAVAPTIKRALDAVVAKFVAGERRVDVLESHGRSVLDAALAFRIQYLQVVDSETCTPRVLGNAIALRTDTVAVAAYLGSTRLIDNVPLTGS